MLGLEDEIRVAIVESDCVAAIEDLTTDPDLVFNEDLYESGQQVIQLCNQIIGAEVQVEGQVELNQHLRI